MSRSSPRWTIGELGRRVEAALAVDYPGQSNGKVREVPNLRTLRYYAALGLLDPPADMQGRTALYGKRHVLQLVAIKRLQAEGLTLVDVQQRLAGLADRELAKLARVPASTWEEDASPPPAAPDRRQGAFWSARPAPVHPVEQPAAALVQAVTVAAELTLLVNVPGPLEPQQLEALRQAALPLLETLRGLTRPQESEDP